MEWPHGGGRIPNEMTMYGVRVTMYGVRVAMYGVRVAMYGVRVAMYRVRVAMYRVRVAMYGYLMELSPCEAQSRGFGAISLNKEVMFTWLIWLLVIVHYGMDWLGWVRLG
jgi:hypothetical protein